MPHYRYKAVSADGEPLEGVLEAASRDAAVQHLQAAGHLPLQATEERPGGRVLTPRPLRSRRVSRTEVTLFTRELATLLRAGLPLDQALRMLESLTGPERVRAMVQGILQHLQGGASFSEALTAQNVFDRLYLNLVRAGEISGALEAVLERLSLYLEHSAELRSSVISALIYPLILLTLTGISLLVLLLFVIPRFAPLFEDAGQALPLSTQIVFGSAELLRQYWYLLPMTALVLAGLLHVGLRNPRYRYWLDEKSLRIPLLGTLMLKLDLVRFAQTLSTLLGNGVPILEAVSIVRDVLHNRALASVMEPVAQSLRRGGRLSEELDRGGYFPPLAVQLIQVGEETGQTEKLLLQLARLYEQEARTLLQRLLALIGPLMILVLGCLIASIIISTLLAILSLNELVL